ncbi:MAG: ABC transporter permease subunit, partial [Dehalococcoidia bacterium]
ILTVVLFLGEWFLIVAVLSAGSGALMLILLPRIFRSKLEARPYLSTKVAELKERLGLWIPFMVFISTAFFFVSYASGRFDKLPGGLFSTGDPIPPIAGVSPGLLVTHIMLATPYLLIILTATIRRVENTLDQASATLGAGPFTTLRKVVMPVMLPGLAAAAFFAFLVSFDELLIALFLSTAQASTLPKVIWDGIRTEISPTIAAVSTLLVMTTVIILAGAVLLQTYLRKRAGAVQ